MRATMVRGARPEGRCRPVRRRRARAGPHRCVEGARGGGRSGGRDHRHEHGQRGGWPVRRGLHGRSARYHRPQRGLVSVAHRPGGPSRSRGRSQVHRRPLPGHPADSSRRDQAPEGRGPGAAGLPAPDPPHLVGARDPGFPRAAHSVRRRRDRPRDQQGGGARSRVPARCHPRQHGAPERVLPRRARGHGRGRRRGGDVIARGGGAARAALREIGAALAMRRVSGGAGTPRAPVTDAEPVLGPRVRLDPAGLVPAGFLARALGVNPGTWVSRGMLDQRMSRLYATGLFESVGYRLEQGDLTVLLRQRSGGRFGLGLRYESRYKASVLLSSTLGHIAGGFSGRADARLGQQIQVGAGVSQPVGDGRSVTLGAEADYVRSPFDLYQGDHRVAQARVDLGAITGSLARTLGTAVDVSCRVKAEHARWGEDVSAVASPPINRTVYTVAGVIQLGTYDRGLFPHSGIGFRAVSEWGNRMAVAAGGAAFSHHVADLRGSLPLVRRVSLWAGATVGASGGEPPPYYQFFLGGANTYYIFPDRDIAFVGLRTQQRRGRHVQKAELGAQWELGPDVFARVRWNAGTVLDRWSFDPARYVDGMGVELGAKTFAGRLSLSASGNAHTSWPMIEIDLGYPF